MPLEVIAHSSGCEDGACPTFFRDTDTGDVVVRGYTDAGCTTEQDVRIPAAEWTFLTAQLR